MLKLKAKRRSLILKKRIFIAGTINYVGLSLQFEIDYCVGSSSFQPVKNKLYLKAAVRTCHSILLISSYLALQINSNSTAKSALKGTSESLRRG